MSHNHAANHTVGCDGGNHDTDRSEGEYHDDNESDHDEPEYELERIAVIDGRIHLEVWTVVPPPLEYLAQLSSQRQEISGRQVWTGSLVLSHVLGRLYDKDPTYFHQKRILELGSGTGVVGMVVSKLPSLSPSSSPVSQLPSTSSSCVVLTDGDVKAVNLLQKNLKNPFNEIPQHVKARIMRWGYDASTLWDSNNADQQLIQQIDDENTHFDDWCRREWSEVWKVDEPVLFDLLLAGDVLYKEELPKLFFETVQRYMTNGPNGILCLCHVPRANVSHDVVVTAAQQAGFRISECWTYNASDLSLIEGCPIEDLQRAKVFKVTRTHVPT